MVRKNFSTQESLSKAVQLDSEVTFITSSVFDLLKSSLRTKISEIKPKYQKPAVTSQSSLYLSCYESEASLLFLLQELPT